MARQKLQKRETLELKVLRDEDEPIWGFQFPDGWYVGVEMRVRPFGQARIFGARYNWEVFAKVVLVQRGSIEYLPQWELRGDWKVAALQAVNERRAEEIAIQTVGERLAMLHAENNLALQCC